MNQLGYLDLGVQVQNVKKMPKNKVFPNANFPALKVTVGYAQRGTGQEKKLQEGRAANIVQLDISFKDQVYAFQELILQPTVMIRAYSVVDTLAEKLRALIQQPVRNRFRRQDVYDICHLLENVGEDQIDKGEVLTAFSEKAKSHGLEINAESLENPEVKENARKEWAVLTGEISGELADFDGEYEKVSAFYRNLGWD